MICNHIGRDHPFKRVSWPATRLDAIGNNMLAKRRTAVSLEEDELERLLPNTHDWQTMSPGGKMAWLLNAALDVKRDILTMVYVADDSGNPLGWVYREYVVCKGETRH